MNLKRFIEESQKIKEILEIQENNIETREFHYKKYLSDSKDGYEYLLACLKAKRTKSLVLAPTGSGKTFIFDTLFREINKDMINIRKEVKTFEMPESKKEVIKSIFMDSLDSIPVLIMLTANRIQNEQNSVSYDMTSVIGKKNNLYVYDVEKVNTFSAVYEKITELVEFCSKNRKKKLSIKLVIDEAQLLQDAILYRNETIDNIHMIEDFIMERDGSIVYLTATPEPIQNLSFDRIVFFKKEGYKAPMNVINIVPNEIDSKCSMEKFVLNQIATSNKKHFVRYNDKEVCKKLCDNLNLEFGKNALSVNSEEKDFVEKVNKFTGEKELVFNNSIFNDVANYSSLPASKDGKEATHWFSTSLFDVGTNVKGITEYFADGENVYNVYHNINHAAEYLDDDFDVTAQKHTRKCNINPSVIPFKEDIVSDFVISKPNNMNVVSIIQFFNRVRYSTSEANIFLKDVPNTSFYNDKGEKTYIYTETYIDKETKEEKTIIHTMKELVDIVKEFKKLAEKQFDIYKKSTEIIKYRALNEEDYKFQIQREINLKNSKEQRVYLRCIKLDKDLIPYIDKNILFKEAYDAYQTQFAYYHDALIDVLEEELNVKVVLKKGEKSTISVKDIKKEQIQDVLHSAISNNDFLSQIHDNKITSPELEVLKGSEQYTNVRNLMRYGIKVDEAVEIVATTTPYKITQKLNSLTRELAKTLTDKQKNYIVDICRDKMLLTDIKNDEVRDKIYTLLNSKYSNYIKKAILFDVDIDFVINRLIKSTSPNNFKRDMQVWNYIENNKKYIENPDLVTLPEQKVMLDMFYKHDKDGKLIQTSISNRSGKRYLKELKKYGNHDNYTLDDFYRIATELFTLYKKENGFIVASLKVKH